MKIGWNLIESVEQLHRMNCPNLTDLVLRDNLITDAKSLRKCSFPELR